MILHQKTTTASLFGTRKPTPSAESGRALGIVTNNYSPFLVDPETGEAKPLTRAADDSLNFATTPQKSRSNRWALKSVVNRVLSGSRTSKCMVLRAPAVGGGLSPIQVQKGQTCKRAFYQGLMACGSVWTCPVCASKIAERRRSELAAALDSAKAQGLRVHFVTLTVPHGIGDDINELLAGLRGALKRLSQGKHAISAQLKGSLVGYIRTLEVTHGQNGWHPHYHLLVFTDSAITSDKLHSVYGPAWQRACRLAGLPIPSDLHGCTVQDGAHAGKYVSKWGLEDEMTKSHIKQTRRKGATPWGLLGCVLDNDDPEYSAERATALFRLYAAAFKGSRQLHWSTKLREKLDVGQEVSDDVLVAAEDDERALLIGELSVEQWRIVRKVKAEAALLDAAESHPDAFHGLLAHLVTRAEFHRGISSGRAEARNTDTDGPHCGTPGDAAARGRASGVP